MHTQACARARARAHTCTHAHARTHTHVHAHTQKAHAHTLSLMDSLLVHRTRKNVRTRARTQAWQEQRACVWGHHRIHCRSSGQERCRHRQLVCVRASVYTWIHIFQHMCKSTQAHTHAHTCTHTHDPPTGSRTRRASPKDGAKPKTLNPKKPYSLAPTKP